MGEQPNAWELLHPRAKVSRHRILSVIANSVDYIFTLPIKEGVGVLAPVKPELYSVRNKSLRGYNPTCSTWME